MTDREDRFWGIIIFIGLFLGFVAVSILMTWLGIDPRSVPGH